MNKENKVRLYLIAIPCMCLIGIVSGLWISNSVYGLALGMFLSAVLSFPFMLGYSKENPGVIV